jgi:hypothetical protein
MMGLNTGFWKLFMVLVLLALALVGCSPTQNDAPAATSTTAPDDEVIQEQTEPEEAGTDDLSGDKTALALPAGACANSLFPLELGNQWVYALDPDPALLATPDVDTTNFDTFTWTVVEVSESQATLEISAEEPGFTATYTVECKDGAILTFPAVSLDLVFGGGEFGSADLGYAHGSGVFLPSMETFEANNWDYEWQTELLLSGEIRTVIDNTQEFVATMDESPLMFNWSTSGSGDTAFETIEVFAGEFEALKLDLNSEFQFNIDMAGSSFSADFTTDESQWYAPGIGLLQTVSDSAQMELSGMTLPFEDEAGDVSLMLVEFRSGVN